MPLIDSMLRQVLSHWSLQRLEFGEGCLEMRLLARGKDMQGLELQDGKLKNKYCSSACAIELQNDSTIATVSVRDSHFFRNGTNISFFGHPTKPS